jgi:hypothetical protein
MGKKIVEKGIITDIDLHNGLIVVRVDEGLFKKRILRIIFNHDPELLEKLTSLLNIKVGESKKGAFLENMMGRAAAENVTGNKILPKIEIKIMLR